MLVSVLKWIDAPGSIPFLVICVLAGVVVRVAVPRAKRATTRWFAAVAALYVGLSLPMTAGAIAGSLPAVRSPLYRIGDPVDVLVVFDGDNRRGRVREARRIHDAAHPLEVWSLGWEVWMHGALAEAGIPPSRLHHDVETTTTREQIGWVANRMRTSPESRVVIVASRLQVPRVEALLRAAGVSPGLAVSPADREPSAAGIRAIVPTYYALRISRDALYEHAALRYYRWRGWTR